MEKLKVSDHVEILEVPKGAKPEFKNQKGTILQINKIGKKAFANVELDEKKAGKAVVVRSVLKMKLVKPAIK